MTMTELSNSTNLPSIRDFAFQLFIPDHLAARGFVGFAVLVGEVELNKPIVIYRLCECLKFRDLLAVQLNLFVDTSENGRYTKGKIALTALAELLQRGLQRLKTSEKWQKSLF